MPCDYPTSGRACACRWNRSADQESLSGTTGAVRSEDVRELLDPDGGGGGRDGRAGDPRQGGQDCGAPGGGVGGGPGLGARPVLGDGRAGQVGVDPRTTAAT